jgi:hypothetical protein
MKYIIKFIGLALTLAISLPVRAQEPVQSIPVDGDKEYFDEAFNPSVYVNSPERSEELNWTGPTFSYKQICPKDSTLFYCQYAMMHQEGTLFVRGNAFAQKQNGGHLSRNMSFEIKGRNPDAPYQITVLQRAVFETPESFRARSRTEIRLQCFDSGSDIIPVKTEVGIGGTDFTASATMEVAPQDCTANKFRVMYLVDGAKSINIHPLKVTIIEEGKPL